MPNGLKPRRSALEIFSLSFLDIISCAFGAVIMLVLLSKNGDEGQFFDTSVLTQLLLALNQTEDKVDELQGELQAKQQTLQQTSLQIQQTENNKTALESDVARAQDQVQQLDSKASGLQQVLQARQRAAINAGKAENRAEEVGGIPVDSEYVIFIVDTSGSMKSIWGKVIQQMDNILNNHPKVKGFQIMSDMGDYLLSASAGRWRPDTPGSRRAMLNALRSWNSMSNSSPVEGLQVALSTYAAKTESLSIYILGDDYTGGSYDAVINTLNKLNTNKINGKRLARVHAVGFLSGSRNKKYSTLMREVTRQNRGTFLALPR